MGKLVTEEVSDHGARSVKLKDTKRDLRLQMKEREIEYEDLIKNEKKVR